MSKNLWLGIGAVIVIVLIFVLFSGDSETPPADNGDAGQAAPALVVLGEQNDSGEEGTAVLSEVGGKVEVVIDLTGAPTDTPQPAHIHSGDCLNLGPVSAPLNSVVNGKSTTVLDVSLNQLILQEVPRAINVHKSAAEVQVYVACGNLR